MNTCLFWRPLLVAVLCVLPPIQAFGATTVRPPNDAFANAITLDGYQASIEASTLNATLESGEFRWADNRGGHSIWYNWTAPDNGIGTLSGTGPGSGLMFSVYVGDSLGLGAPGTGPKRLTIVNANAYSISGIPLSFDVVGGTIYRISVDGYEGEQGDISFQLRLTPPNDTFRQARDIHGDQFETFATTRGGTREVNEPEHGSLVEGRSVWWSWLAPASGMTTFTGSSTNMQPVIAVYTWETLTNLTQELTNLVLVAGGNEVSGNEATVQFNAEAGTRYFIALDGTSSEGTFFNLSMTMSLLRITSPLPGQIFPAPSTLQVSAQVPPGLTGITSIELFANDQHLATLATTPFSWTWQDVPDGSHTIIARAVDAAGATNSSLPVSVLIYTNNITPSPKIGGRHAINALGQLSTWGLHRNGDFGLTLMDIPLCPDPFDPFCEGSGELLSTARFAAYPPGVTAWKDVSSSGFALGNNGVLYYKGVTPTNPEPPATTWNYLHDDYMIDDLGRLYLLGLIRGVQGPYPWIEASGPLSMTTNRALYHFDGLEFNLVPWPAGVTEWRAFSGGLFHQLAIGNDGNVYSWGFNYSYQLGLGDRDDRALPTLVTPPPGVTNWVAVATGGHHSMALAEDGQLYAWGRNWENQLGVGYTPNQTTNHPAQVIRPAGVTRWLSIGATFFQSYAIGDNCQLYAWGDNGSGELGVGTAPSSVYPQPVVGLGPLCGFPVVVAGNSSRLPDGNFKVEFRADLNQNYTIQYSSDGHNWISVFPSITGAGGNIQWIDDGPPKTDTPPASQPTRFYRIITGQ